MSLRTNTIVTYIRWNIVTHNGNLPQKSLNQIFWKDLMDNPLKTTKRVLIRRYFIHIIIYVSPMNIYH